MLRDYLYRYLKPFERTTFVCLLSYLLDSSIAVLLRNCKHKADSRAPISDHVNS